MDDERREGVLHEGLQLQNKRMEFGRIIPVAQIGSLGGHFIEVANQ